MRALLDTHAFLWWDLDDPHLSALAADLIGDGQSEILVSAASLWEIALKVGHGRLKLPGPIERYVPARLATYRFGTLPVSAEHALRVARLPEIHRDPFDRLLVAQAQVEGLPIVTADPAIGRYDVDVLW